MLRFSGDLYNVVLHPHICQGFLRAAPFREACASRSMRKFRVVRLIVLGCGVLAGLLGLELLVEPEPGHGYPRKHESNCKTKIQIRC